MAARYTNKKAARLCNRVLSYARAAQEPAPAITNAWQDASGRTYVCDGFRAYRLNASPDGLSEVWSYHIMTADERQTVARVHAGVEQMFAALDYGSVDPMPAPEAEQVNAAQAARSVYDLGDDFPAADARFLRDALELLPGAAWYCTHGEKRMISPIYAASADGAAAILPVYTPDKRRRRSA